MLFVWPTTLCGPKKGQPSTLNIPFTFMLPYLNFNFFPTYVLITAYILSSCRTGLEVLSLVNKCTFQETARAGVSLRYAEMTVLKNVLQSELFLKWLDTNMYEDQFSLSLI